MFQTPRRGLDELNKALLFLALIGGLCSLFFPYGTVARVVCTAVLAVSVAFAAFRLFSANRDKRYQENQKYLLFTTGVRERWTRLTARTHERPAREPRRPKAPREPKPPREPKRGKDGDAAKNHRARRARKNPTWNEIKHYKYLICPQCTQRLRVPRGKGRLRVTCTRCGNKFETRS